MSDLVGVQQVRWDSSGTKLAFLYRKRNDNHELGIAKRVEFVSDKMPYIILRGCWYHVIVLSIHAPIDVEDSFCQ
jgi:hypothetical protein